MGFVPGARKAHFCGYDDKDKRILDAVSLVNASRGQSGFSYFVTRDPLLGMNLIYFNFRLHGVRQQVSFHTFLELKLNNNIRHKTRWDEKDSRKAALFLACEIFLAE